MTTELNGYIRDDLDDGKILSTLPEPSNEGITVVPIGGLGRIGMNWTLYGTKGRWMLVDAGIGFLQEDIEGIDAYIPDPIIFEDIKDKIDGLVITHAHEDHIGAIDRVFPETLDCPIYATPFASGIINRRLGERGIDDVDVITFNPGDKFQVGPLTVDTVELTHSVPEPVGLYIQHGDTSIFHTGDWKFDDCPVIGNGTDWDKLDSIGESGVTALVCDSTNAHKPLEKTSEADVREAFQEVFENVKSKVVVACFGTNIARVESAVNAATDAGRKVILGGYSLKANYKLAEQLKLVQPNRNILVHPSHAKGLDPEEIAIICTGVQGEKNASLYKMVQNDPQINRLPALETGDVVIMSSRVIPGNEEAVESLISMMESDGISVLTADDKVGCYPVHVSGHAGALEIEEMHDIIKPSFVIPVHGDTKHLDAHEKLSQTDVVRGGEGTILHVTPNAVHKLGKIYVNVVALRSDEHGNRLPYKKPEEISSFTM